LLVTHALRADGFDASEDGTGRGTPLVPVAHIDVLPTMRNGADTPAGHNARSGETKDDYIVPVAFESRFARNGRGAPSEIVPPLKAQSGETGKGDAAPLTMQGMQVRRLTPRECERLQGFPDDYTLISAKTADGPRYKALGNSMAVPCMRWIGERIQMVEEIK
jgi:DNA (cytosine-5)-methyltransferase 1